MTVYSGLGFDPVSGDPDAVAELARDYRMAAEALVQAESSVGRARGLPWTGPAADAFRSGLPVIDPGNLHRAADILDDWAHALAVAKSTADRLDRQAAVLRRQLADVEDELDRLRDFEFTGTDHSAAAARGTDLLARLDAVLRDARTLAADHLNAAAAVADRLDSLRGQHIPATGTPATVSALLRRMSSTTAALAGLVIGHPPGVARPTGAVAAVVAERRR
ncbi:hypothetical protein [Actinokineospora inagensis]|uniref:hypothetical protein n=1 Tax=Actinokineospora inagensis TaxID=103730 RepID=UPI000411B1EF|nr:hypothetical protein [Actinokineospora inagensis]